MPEKRGRRQASRKQTREENVVVEGPIGRFVDRACDNPAMTGGLFVMALTATAIVSNAMFLQSVRHPEPLFATRPPLVIERNAPQPPPAPPRRDDQTGSIPPLPRPAPTVATAEAAVTTTEAGDSLVREIQTVLAEKGLYLGAIDGEYGPLSQSAIAAYQTAQGLEVTGQPSTALLEHLRAPAPSAGVTPRAARAEAPTLPKVDVTEADNRRLRYERVQSALNRIGYGPLIVNGEANEETVNAIRRFELDNGLPISGDAGDAVIDRLIAIGALPAV